MDESTYLRKRACVGLLLLMWFHVVRGDYPCLCSYALEKTVYQAKEAASGTIGYMYEFDCKPLYEPLAQGQSWMAIQFEHKVGYVQMSQDQVIQQCPGAIPEGDQVAVAPSAATSTSQSSTQSFTTQAPTTQPPTTQPPTTQPPTTQPSTTQQSTTQPSTTLPPTTQPSTKTTLPTSTTSLKPTEASTTTTQLTHPTVHTTSTSTNVPLTYTNPPLTTKPHASPLMTSPTHPPAYTCSHKVVTYASQHHGYVMPHGESCFELVQQLMTWNQAEYNCQSKGGHLTYINNQEEENTLLLFMYDHGFTHAVWIGLTDQHREQHFTWSSGNSLKWTNWIPGRHNTHYFNNEDCVALVPDVPLDTVSHSNSFGTWDDAHCHEAHPFICRYDAHPVTQTAHTTPTHSFGHFPPLFSQLFG